jgi:hypothetical protein
MIRKGHGPPTQILETLSKMINFEGAAAISQSKYNPSGFNSQMSTQPKLFL